jgi:hypothetical protein
MSVNNLWDWYNSRFRSVATAGNTFQAGSAAIDSATIMSALVFQLTGKLILAGPVTAILRFGWLFPLLIVGFLAQRGGSSMRYCLTGLDVVKSTANSAWGEYCPKTQSYFLGITTPDIHDNLREIAQLCAFK